MKALLDKNGLTESEFLAQYDASKYDRPSVTVDIICIKNDKLLLIRRGGHPNLGKMALPGGFLEPTEDLYSAAARELWEETGLRAVNLRLVGCFSDPARDPRTRIVTAAFLAETCGSERAGDDASEACWCPYTLSESDGIYTLTVAKGDEVLKTTLKKKHFADSSVGDDLYETVGKSALAGDHAEIICKALLMQKI